jgi:tubulin polyglutamylase TTLL5
MVVSEYIFKPLLIDGIKFDLRVYVALTSINPLRIYIYEDGLARYATGKYNDKTNSKQAKFTHLTNYSLNKFSSNFVENTDATQDDYGHKWSHAALRKRLKSMGVDDVLLWRKIEDLIIKTVLSVEPQICNANEMFCPYPRTNCFELFGFDVLID